MIKLKELLLKEFAAVVGLNDELIDLGFEMYFPGDEKLRLRLNTLWTADVKDENKGIYAKAFDKMNQPFYFRFFNTGKSPDLVSHPPADATVLPDNWLDYIHPRAGPDDDVEVTVPDNWKNYIKKS